MTESNQPAPPPPAWDEAMQGKGGNAKRAAASKRIFIVLSLTFFGMFLWMYIIYSLGHQKKTESGETAQNHGAPIPASGQPIAPVAAASPFGMPRGMDGTYQAPVAAAPQMPASYGAPTSAPYRPAASYAPQANPYAAPVTGYAPQANPYGAPVTGYAPQANHGYQGGNPYAPAAYQVGAAPPNSTAAITAPRDYRHAIGVPPSAVGAPASAQHRARTVVTR